MDAPWCFFDMSEAHLYLGNPDATEAAPPWRPVALPE